MVKALFARLQSPFLFAFTVVVFTSSLTLASAQAPTASDPSAIAALRQSINAMGGGTAWAQVTDAIVTGSCIDETAQTSEPFEWVTQGAEFRYQSGSGSEQHVMLSGHGAPSSTSPSGTQSLTPGSASLLKPFHLPGQALAAIINEPSYIATIAAQAGASSNSAIHIHVVHRLIHANESGSDQEWWFDSQTYLPLSVTYKVPGQTIQSYMDETYSFSTWTVEGFGAQVPLQITLSTSIGVPPQVCTSSQIQFNTNPSSSLFDAR